MNNLFTADFETTTNANDCRVWAYDICEIGGDYKHIYGNNIDDFMSFCSQKENYTLYFHNLKFDGEFIFYWLFRNGFKHVENSKQYRNKTFTTLINDKGQFYCIEVCFYKKGKKINKVKFYDSLKILNFSVSAIAKGFNLPISKLKIDYHKYRPVGHILDKKEIEYIKNDTEIVARALDILFKQGMKEMTIGSDALTEYKRLIGKKQFEKYFPILDLGVDTDIRKSYKGGFTYLNDKYKGKTIKSGVVLDVNSLYPSVMYFNKLPYGVPLYFKGKYKNDKLYDLYIQRIECQFEIKENHIPTIQLKNNLAFMPTEYLKTSKNEVVELVLTNVDLKLFLEHYNVYNIKYIDGYKFKSTDKLFKKYIDKWINVKIESKNKGNKAMYLLAKLMLNSLYGKFALNPRVRGKIPTYGEDEKIHYKYTSEEIRDSIYVPIGAFVTSWARYKTITSAQKVYERFIYADTDSLHLEDYEIPEELGIDDNKLGYWKNELIISKGKYLRQKSYMEYGYDPFEKVRINDIINNSIKTEKIIKNFSNSHSTIKIKERNFLIPLRIRRKRLVQNFKFATFNNISFIKRYDIKITCAGMPTSCYKYVNFDNFNIGSQFDGKKSLKHVKGGIILEDTTFTIKS